MYLCFQQMMTNISLSLKPCLGVNGEVTITHITGQSITASIPEHYFHLTLASYSSYGWPFPSLVAVRVTLKGGGVQVVPPFRV